MSIGLFTETSSLRLPPARTVRRQRRHDSGDWVSVSCKGGAVFV